MNAAEQVALPQFRSCRSDDKTFAEFFAGIGLIHEGLKDSGWQCVYANDNDPKKRELYELQFGGLPTFHLEDVRQTDAIANRLTDSPFLATASFPCTDLSLAGHWRGFAGEHSSTFFGFADVLDRMADRRPAMVMLENVTGFITSQEGRDFASATQTLAELGYWVDAFVLDAKAFVPQSRPRVFVIGLRDDIDLPLASRKSEESWFGNQWAERIKRASRSIRPNSLVQLMESIELPTGWTAFNMPTPNERQHDIVEFIDLDDTQEWWDTAAVEKHHDMMNDRHRKFIDDIISSRGSFVGTIFRRKRDGKTRAEVRSDGLAGCLRTPKGGSARQIVIAIERGRLKMRWMSPREYARLQGVPDFPLVANTIQNLFGFGDAVCVPVIRWIDRHVLTPVYEAVVNAPSATLR